MPTFMDSLAANPNNQNPNNPNPNSPNTSSSNIYGQPPIQNQPDALSLVNKIKDRQMQDFKDKANFMQDLGVKQEAIRQGKLRTIYNLNTDQGDQNQQQNTVMGRDPNEMTGYEKGELGIRQQQLGQEGQRIAQTGKLGEERLGIQSAQEKLNQQKSDQINQQKTADMQRKVDESNQKIELAQQRLQQSGDNQAAQLEAHKALAAAVEERHKLEMANMQNRFDTTSKQHQETIDALNKRLGQSGSSKTTTELNADGTKKTVTTQRGSTITVKGKDNQDYEIPADQLDDWNANHAADQTDEGQ